VIVCNTSTALLCSVYKPPVKKPHHVENLLARASRCEYFHPAIFLSISLNHSPF